MKLKLYILAHKSGQRGVISGEHRGVYWQDGVTVTSSYRRLRELRRRLGGEYKEVEVEVPIFCTCERGQILCDCGGENKEAQQEAQQEEQQPESTSSDEEPADDASEEELSYQDKLAALKDAKDEGVFDWYEYTDGSRSGDDVDAAYARLQELTS